MLLVAPGLCAPAAGRPFEVADDAAKGAVDLGLGGGEEGVDGGRGAVDQGDEVGGHVAKRLLDHAGGRQHLVEVEDEAEPLDHVADDAADGGEHAADGHRHLFDGVQGLAEHILCPLHDVFEPQVDVAADADGEVDHLRGAALDGVPEVAPPAAQGTGRSRQLLAGEPVDHVGGGGDGERGVDRWAAAGVVGREVDAEATSGCPAGVTLRSAGALTGA